ncbi:DUF1266 domain-containing protein [Gordonia sp. TBRC 11910]|uniref:DUF1266 domain-containing protein n=1 Tax=Gordonia asplenii TaxID=2725283 RepID=A0A848KVM8_9ACTN|nr:DUF1266 domain-containing protein [Gordonia asplenii]NMO00925.1 DUF1266 domain-containing protein [Gordonia asplenii]
MGMPPIQPFPFSESSPLATAFTWTGTATLTPDQQAALNVGAILNSTNGFACDTLAVGESPDDARRRMVDWWGVDSAVSARITVGRLLDGMHSRGFEVVAPLVADAIDSTDGLTIDNHREFLTARLIGSTQPIAGDVDDYNALYNLRTMDILRPVLRNENFPDHIRAWDLGRIPFIVRMSLRCGYLTDDEVWPLLSAALSAARDYYANWRQFAHGYLIGRAYWMAGYDLKKAGTAANEVGAMINALLVRQDSPWRRQPLAS